jgi:hypothetical protein
MQQGISDQTCACDPSTDILFSATSDQTTQSEEDTSRVRESGQLNSSGNIRKVTATRGEIPLKGDLSATTDPSITIQEIRSGDYIEINKGFGPGPCDCCGKSWVNYQERMTSERLSGPPRPNLKICKKCFEIARQAETASIRTLPGVLNPVTMTRLTTDLGRCQICDTQKAIWYDADSRTAICEVCYRNLPRGGGASGEAASDGGA